VWFLEPRDGICNSYLFIYFVGQSSSSSFQTKM
jgi:hypothetical protein